MEDSPCCGPYKFLHFRIVIDRSGVGKCVDGCEVKCCKWCGLMEAEESAEAIDRSVDVPSGREESGINEWGSERIGILEFDRSS